MLKFPLSALLCLLLLTSCSQQPDNQPTANASDVAAATLPGEIAETSALVCTGDQQFLTINDSGNPAVLYRLDQQGRIVQRLNIEAQNQDWEALTMHQGKLWIADIGNNTGQRTELQLYTLPLPAPSDTTIPVTTYRLRYPGPTPKAPALYQHEFDAEALVSTSSELLLFSKNWQGDTSRVYQVDTSQTASELQQVGTTSVLPGLITDVAYSATAQVFIVAGYQNFRQNPLPLLLSGDFVPFLAILDRQYQLLKTVPVATGGQVEAVCLDTANNIWLSQEGSARHPAQMWQWGNLATLMTETN